MSLFAVHLFLVTGEDRATCEQRVRNFLHRTPLVSYDRITLVEEMCCCALDPSFESRLQDGLEKNREQVRTLARELKEEGFVDLEQLALLPQGYPSKMLHTIAHLSDGFFGIDAYFFDLDESSCQLSPARRQQILAHPDHCWLIGVEAHTMDSNGFERLKKAMR